MNEIGGQAVIEGVMMRSQNKVGLAVRKSDGKIVTKFEKVKPITEKYPILKMPVFRGIFSLFSAMAIGIKYLTISANIASAEPGLLKEEEENLSTGEIIFTIGFALLVGVSLFVLLPAGLSMLTEYLGVQSRLAVNIIEGFIRIFVFLIYVYSISKLEDIEKVFMYHGAEHKTIYALENSEKLTVENVKKYSRFHPRCGTSFLMFVMIISMCVFSFITTDDWYLKTLLKVLLMPVVAGLSFEAIKMAGKNITNPLVKFLIKPGMLLQILTTREPEKEHLEVAIEAVNRVIDEE
ncbi:MAG: DUF1385 domain-containing protein [Candidatus Muiribacteriota bacterium]